MLRKMLKLIALTGLLFPVSVFALGLGDVDLKSYLNQPLKAEIEILSIDSSELENLKVRLAPRSQFEVAKIEYQPHLDSLRLSVAKKVNGKSYIIISSDSSFREPYLNILIEVKWSKGQILREYALLIDPAIVVPNKNQQIATKPTETKQTEKQASESQQAENTDLGFPKDPDTDENTTKVENPYKEPERTTTAQAKNNSNTEKEKYPRIPLSIDNNTEAVNTANVDNSTTASSKKYRVSAGDTMMEIAKRYQRNGSLYQTMMAIKKANPNAFINNNVHLVKANAQLVIPDSTTIEALSQADAIQQFQEQTQVWRQGSSAPVAIVKSKPETSSGEKEGHFVLKPPNQDDKVKGLSDTALMVENNKEVPTVGGNKNSDLETVKRDIEAEGSETLVDRKSQLEKSIKEKEGILSVESTALTELQNRAQIRQYCKDANVTDRSNCFKVEGFQPVDINELENKGKSANPPFNQYDDAGGVGTKLVALAKKWFVYLKENPLMTAIGAGFALFSIIIVFLIIRQHRRARDEFEESILDFEEDSALRNKQQRTSTVSTTGTVATQASMPTSGMSNFGGGMQTESVSQSSVGNETQSSYLSDFVVSDMNDISSGSGESDPITEADVFYAYGKYEAAEMLIKEAIENEPNRLDLRYKLLDIYHGAKNKAAFELAATELSNRVKNKQDPSWLRVVEMGRELAPDNAMFSGGKRSAPTPTIPPAPTSAPIVDDDIPSTTLTPADGSKQIVDDLDLNFDFDLDDTKDPMSNTKSATNNDLADLPKRAEGSENVVSFNPTDNSIADFASSDAGDYENAGFLSDADEVGTKLDLAKAYIDMGDPEGARSILDEVLEEGNEKQKGEAQDLMQQMAG